MDLFPKKLFATNQSVKTLLIRGLLLMVILGAQPWLWGAVAARVKDFQQKRFQSEQIDRLNTQLGDIKKSQNDQQELMSQLDLVIPPRTSLAQVIERLERVAVERSVRLEISDIQDEPNNNQPLVAIVPVTVLANVTGQAQQILQYLDAIENLPELTIVKEWTLEPTNTSETAKAATADPVASSSPVPTGPPLYTMSFKVTFMLQTTSNAKK